jgi:hypothetical protein
MAHEVKNESNKLKFNYKKFFDNAVLFDKLQKSDMFK